MIRLLLIAFLLNTFCFGQNSLNIDIKTDYKRWDIDYIAQYPKPPYYLQWTNETFNGVGSDVGVSIKNQLLKADVNYFWNFLLGEDKVVHGIESQFSINTLWFFNSTKESDLFIGPNLIYRRMTSFVSAKFNSIGLGLIFNWRNWMMITDYLIFIEPFPDITYCNYQCDMNMLRISLGYIIPVVTWQKKEGGSH